MIRLPTLLLGLILPMLATGCGRLAGRSHYVVLIVCDGLRADAIGPENTPTLARLAREGVTFTQHHAVYPSSTEVNGTALITGAYPARNGLMANHEYRPAFDPTEYINTEDHEVVAKGDRLTGGHYLKVPTLPELFQRAGYRTAIVGAKGVTLLLDRKAGSGLTAERESVTLERDDSLPASAAGPIIEALGHWPHRVAPNIAQDDWVTRALTEHLWARGVPRLSVLWLSEPDYSQHSGQPGSSDSVAAIKNSDACVEKILEALETRGIRDQTDVMVVSDHGFSTIYEFSDMASALRLAGFRAVEACEDPPKDGEIFVVSLGGSVLFYVTDHDAKKTRRLVEFLQQDDRAGVILTREPMEGTFSLEQLKIDTPEAPDVVMSLKWNDKKNESGVPGLLSKRIPGRPGFGLHASLSRFDLHGVMIATGPHFRRGLVSSLPSGAVDVAPTIAHISGIDPGHSMEGRVLNESLTSAGADDVTGVQVETLEVKRDFAGRTWRQYLKISRLETAVYVTEGNGGASPVSAQPKLNIP